ncbi:hatching enzyme 1.2-like [Hydractinia symbiolongicarpus]|uniref:hatching enzyme 1.2-like n=1 Tax=Hydractinia symbiolongicarpus TaxID=13093 RepID=UPI00254B5DAD|nr:hatching enzyme 1.2-like [Hydractinia symbiolongicarpus]
MMENKRVPIFMLSIFLLLVCVVAKKIDGKIRFHSDDDIIMSDDRIPYGPQRPLDCSDLRLRAADVGACIEMNNQFFGKKSKNPRLDDSDILTDKKVHRRRRVVKHWLAWPKSSDGYVYVPYEFYTSISNITSGFLKAIADFRRVSCIRLVPRTAFHKNYIRVINDEGCYSYIGMQGGMQELSLQAYTSCTRKGTAIHEILHAVGFYHEMSRRDRDKYIDIHYDNIFTSRWKQFAKHEHTNGSVYGAEYDVHSIMHYGNYAFAINRESRTITSLRNPSEVLGQRDGMSQNDILQLNRLYKCDQYL